MKNGGVAFPTSVSADDSGGLNYGEPGMTLRDYFASKAMQPIFQEDENDQTFEEMAERAYAYADAMLAARKSNL